MEFCLTKSGEEPDSKHLVPIALLNDLNANDTVFNLVAGLIQDA